MQGSIKKIKHLENMISLKELEYITNSDSKCVYCLELINTDNYLDCEVCHGSVHVKCLRRSSTPGDMVGDTFFNFTCANCFGPSTSTLAAASSEVDQEKFIRQRMPWVLIITVAIHNLSITSKGLSRMGYFHYRTHIAGFIDKNWDYIFEPATRRRKNWIGSISGCLSHNSPEFFLSGQEVFNEAGWWKMANDKYSPRYVLSVYQRESQKRQEERQGKKNLIDEQPTIVIEAPKEAEEKGDLLMDNNNMICSRMIPYMGRPPRTQQNDAIDAGNFKKCEDQKSFNTVQSHLMDFLAESLSNDDIGMFNSLSHISHIEENANAADNIQSEESQFTITSSVNDSHRDYFSEYDEEPEIKKKKVVHHVEEQSNDDARIIQVTHFQQRKNKENSESQKERQLIDDEDDTNDIENLEMTPGFEDTVHIGPCKPNLFTKNTLRKFPWLLRNNDMLLKNEQNQISERSVLLRNQRLITMSEYEESELLKNMERIFSFEEKYNLLIPMHIRRFFDKLKLRKWNRKKHRPIHNLDEKLEAHRQKGFYLQTQNAEDNNNILDRYQLITTFNNNPKQSFHARIVGHTHYESFKSPYTQRILQPFIYRNKKCVPPWLKLMSEIKYITSGQMPAHACIDFCYIRPYHLAAVNVLLQTMFWPGIDVTECLSYPDYSVVALYKKLVIGCGFLVPDVGFNEAYISFMAVRPGWQKSGIASFMIYHLVQTCINKDITLHVSATNPAVVLYQKFGFKIEELCLNFYEKYLPIDCPHSRHGLFLRLSR